MGIVIRFTDYNHLQFAKGFMKLDKKKMPIKSIIDLSAKAFFTSGNKNFMLENRNFTSEDRKTSQQIVHSKTYLINPPLNRSNSMSNSFASNLALTARNMALS